MSKELDIIVATLCDDEDIDLVTLPKRVDDEDACFDIFPFFKEDKITILPDETVKIRTGIGMTFSKGFVGVLKERSSTGVLGIGQRAGVIDSGYLGEWIVVITNHGVKPVVICKDVNKLGSLSKQDCIVLPYNKAICQVMFIELPKAKLRVVTKSEFNKLKSMRGTNAFGSTDSLVTMTLEQASEQFGVDKGLIANGTETNKLDINKDKLKVGDIVSLAGCVKSRAIVAREITNDKSVVIRFKNDRNITVAWDLDADTIQKHKITRIGKCVEN